MTVWPTPTLQWGTLQQDPSSPMQVATKEYVDAKVGGIPEAPTDGQTYGRDGQTTSWNPVGVASSTVPLMNGTASAGSATTWSRSDHVHPSDSSRAPLNSPIFTGSPNLPLGAVAVTQIAGSNNTTVATTAFVQAALPVASSSTPLMDGTAAVGIGTNWARADHVHPSDTSRAPIGSPTFTGVPAGPTATAGTNTTQLATTAFVTAAIPAVPAPASVAPLMDGAATVGTSTLYARQDHVHPSDTSRAPFGSPAFTGTPTAPTATPGTNTTQLATTAFVTAAIPTIQPATVPPLMNGIATVGTSLLYTRQDHVHPSDTSLLPLSGGTMTGGLIYTATTGNTPRAAQDRAHDLINVMDYGATLNGIAFDNTAYNAARTATGVNGAVQVPYGNQRVNAVPVGGPSSQVLWRMDGTYITSTATPVTGMGTDVVENFFQGNKFYGRANSFTGVSPVFRVDSTLNHAGGSNTGNVTTLKVNTTTSATPADPIIGIASVVTENRTTATSFTSVAVAGYNTKSQPNTGGLFYGANFYTTDQTNTNSSVGGQACGVEIDVIANGLDDGGLAGPYVPAGQGIRTIIQAVGALSNTSGADVVIGWGVRTTPTAGSSHVTFQRAFAHLGRFAHACFSTEYAVADSSAANAIWLGQGHSIAFDQAADVTLVSPSPGTLQVTGSSVLLPADPTVALGAATKQYVDAHSASGMLPLSGGTMTGPLMLTATGGNTSRSVQDQFGDIVDVKDFGAKGDGTTDDTAAFNAAIATGKTILVTPGTYIIQPITITQSMVGLSMDKCILQCWSGGNWASTTMVTQNAASGAVIRDLTIYGANLALYGIFLPQANTQQTGLRIERCQVWGLGTSAATPSSAATAIYAQLDETRPTSKRAIVIADNYVHDIYGNGIEIGGIGCLVTHNTVVNVYAAGIGCDILTDGIISDNTINTSGQGISQGINSDGITGYSHLNLRVLVSNNTVDNSGNNGIHFGGSNIQIVGNKIYNCTVAHGIQLACEVNVGTGNPYPGQNALVANNEIDTAALSGIYCNIFSRVTVVGNTVNNVGTVTSGAGITFNQSSDCIAADNIIWTVVGNGIWEDGCANVQIVNNRINGTTGQAIIDYGGTSTGTRVSDNIITSEGTVSNWDRLIVPLGNGQISLLPPGSGQVYSPNGLTVTQNATYPFQLIYVPGSPGQQELQFQGPNYAIICNGATGNINFLVGSQIATITATGVSVTGTLASSGALTVSAGGANITGSTTLNTGVAVAGGATFGSTFASTATDLTKHIALYGTNYGFCVTSAVINYVSGGFHNFNGPLLTPITTATTTPYTVATANSSLILNPTAAMTLNLPTASGNQVGRTIKLKLIANFAVTSSGANVVPLAGGAATTAIMPATAGKYCTLQSDGTAWQIMEAN